MVSPIPERTWRSARPTLWCSGWRRGARETRAVQGVGRGVHLPAWWFAGSLGVVLAGLWAIQIHPPAGGVFAPFTVLTAQLTAFMLAAIGLPVMREGGTRVHGGGFMRPAISTGPTTCCGRCC